MIYTKEIGTVCYCIDAQPVKGFKSKYDVEITKLVIQYIGKDKFIPEGYKLLSSIEVPYECVYSSLDNALAHAKKYFPTDAKLDLVHLGRDNWKVKVL